MSVKLSLGTKKKTYRSIKLAADAAGMPYITLYMRLRAGMSLAQAVRKPVRVYTRRTLFAEAGEAQG